MPLNKDEAKEAFKEAIKEWLDEQYKSLGHWTFRTVLVAALGALFYFIISFGNWHK